MTHSKGPWRLEEEFIDDSGEYHEPSIVGEMSPDGISPTIATVRIGLEGTDGNAHILAAALDCLEALKVAKNSVECASIDVRTGEELPWYRMAKKAIAKAEGK